MSDVHRAAAALLHRVADGGEIPIEVLREFAELVLHSELVAGAARCSTSRLSSRCGVRWSSPALSWPSG